MIENHLLEQLAAFAKYGTLSEAAKQLNLSQSVLSRSMQKLEQVIGVNLFTRKKIPLPSMTTELKPLNTPKKFWRSLTRQ